MLRSPPLDRRTTSKILSLLSSLLQEGELYRDLKDAVEDANGTVKLPGIHLFTPGGSRKPVNWLLQPTGCDDGALVLAYEEFVHQALGSVKSPGLVAEKLLRQEGASGVYRLLGTSRNPRHWLTPAVRLVALAQRFDGADVSADFRADEYSASVAGAVLCVSPDKVYSNFSEAYLTPAARPQDIGVTSMALKPVSTSSKDLVGLHSLVAEDPDGPTLLRGLVGCLQIGLTSMTEIRSTLRLANRSRRAESARYSTALRDARAAAFEDAMRVLEGGGTNLIRSLYDCVVPVLFTSREFSKNFGSTTSNPERRVRSTTREEWVQRIATRAQSNF